MTSPKKWVRGLRAMFYDVTWNGYKVSLRPQELVRRGHIGKRYAPYLDCQQIGMLFTVIPTKDLKSPEPISSSWKVICVDDGKEYGNGQFEVDIYPYEDKLVTKLIEQPGKYRVLVKLKSRTDEQEFILALLPVSDWGSISLQLIIGIGTLVLSVALSILATIITTQIIR